jgi:outer membrane biosynthesis protein TonB
MFEAANTCASMLFDGLRAQGTNIILNEGPTTTQLHIVARFENDGLNFTWEPKPGDRTEITELAGKIASAIVVYEPGEQKKESTPASPVPAAVVIESPKNTPKEEPTPQKSESTQKEQPEPRPVVKTVEKKPFDYRDHELRRIP